MKRHRVLHIVWHIVGAAINGIFSGIMGCASLSTIASVHI